MIRCAAVGRKSSSFVLWYLVCMIYFYIYTCQLWQTRYKILVLLVVIHTWYTHSYWLVPGILLTIRLLYPYYSSNIINRVLFRILFCWFLLLSCSRSPLATLPPVREALGEGGRARGGLYIYTIIRVGYQYIYLNTKAAASSASKRLNLEDRRGAIGHHAQLAVW